LNPLAHTVRLPGSAPRRVLACGAYLKNRACLIDGDQVHWSALHGDLGDPESRHALTQSVDALLAQARGPLHAVAHDLHPDFYSTQLANTRAQRLGVPAVGVQHHHAHIAVVLAEQGVTVPVIGVALDGMGIGTDGAAWGGEVLWVGGVEQSVKSEAIENPVMVKHWKRLDHLAPLALPGGDMAAREPWRMAAAVLFALGRGDEIETRFAPLVGPAAKTVHAMLQRGVNCPRTSSTGRWFDAAAGAMGISVRQSHEAEAAMALEQLAGDWLAQHRAFTFPWTSLDLHPVVADFFALQGQGAAALAMGAAQFHLALAGGLAHSAIAAAVQHGIHHVVLGGGCLANRVLGQALRAVLQDAGLQVLQPQIAGCGDECLALGQAWVAARSAGAVSAGPIFDLET
jgi:hydrogenase maturation protein HypF